MVFRGSIARTGFGCGERTRNIVVVFGAVIVVSSCSHCNSLALVDHHHLLIFSHFSFLFLFLFGFQCSDLRCPSLALKFAAVYFTPRVPRIFATSAISISGFSLFSLLLFFLFHLKENSTSKNQLSII